MARPATTSAPSLTRLILTHAALLLTSVVVLYPVLWVLKMALTPSQAFSQDPWPFPCRLSWDSSSLVVCEVTLSHFIDVMSTRDAAGGWLFGRQLFNSLFISGCTAVVGMALSCTAGYAMSRFVFPGRDTGMSLFLVTQMFPGVVMAIPLYILMDRLGLLNQMSGLVLVYSSTAIPFCTWNLKGYFDTIPRELEEAARMDGASQWVIFSQIVLPLARPALVVTALFSFMTAWNEFILAATFMGDERSYTLPVVLQSYVGSFGADWGRFSAGAILVSVPVMLLFFALQRHLVEGLTAGGVKG